MLAWTGRFGLIVSLCFSASLSFAQFENQEELPPPLAAGTKLIAGPANSEEFYIIAENDEPKLQQLLAAQNAEQKNSVSNTQANETAQIKVSPDTSKGTLPNIAHTTLSPKQVRNSTTHQAFSSHTKQKLLALRKQHKPTSLELALNNALEKAIQKRSFKTRAATLSLKSHRAHVRKIQVKRMANRKAKSRQIVKVVHNQGSPIHLASRH